MIEIGSRLVSKDYRGLDRQCPRDGNALSLAAAELVRTMVKDSGKSYHIEEVFDAAPPLRLVDVIAIEKGIFNIFSCCQRGKQIEALKDKADIPRP